MLIGQLIGGVIITLLMALIISRVIRTKDIDIRAAWSATAAYLIAAVLYGFGSADGGSFVMRGFYLYLPGAIVAFLFIKKSLERAEDRRAETEDTFG